jgi:hypothetical protein
MSIAKALAQPVAEQRIASPSFHRKAIAGINQTAIFNLQPLDRA